MQLGTFSGWMVALVGLAAFLGHLYPVYFGFKGGKGVATALGVILALNPLTGLLVILTWLLAALTLRYSSLAALLAALAAPVLLYVVQAYAGQPDPWWVAAVAAMTLLLYARHRTNIERLIQGTEPRIGEKKAAPGDKG
jgi:glycerol-3-phosphate acyltransferase PlsY